MSDDIAPDYFVVSQGMLGDQAGRALADVIADSLDWYATQLRERHLSGRFFRLPWRIDYRTNERRCPLGYERYVIGPGEILGPRDANWDSKD